MDLVSGQLNIPFCYDVDYFIYMGACGKVLAKQTAGASPIRSAETPLRPIKGNLPSRLYLLNRYSTCKSASIRYTSRACANDFIKRGDHSNPTEAFLHSPRGSYWPRETSRSGCSYKSYVHALHYGLQNHAPPCPPKPHRCGDNKFYQEDMT